MEKIKKISSARYGDGADSMVYTRKPTKTTYTASERTGVVYNVANESFHSPYSYSTTN